MTYPSTRPHRFSLVFWPLGEETAFPDEISVNTADEVLNEALLHYGKGQQLRFMQQDFQYLSNITYIILNTSETFKSISS